MSDGQGWDWDRVHLQKGSRREAFELCHHGGGGYTNLDMC